MELNTPILGSGIRNLADSGAGCRPRRSREPYSLTKIKGPFYRPVVQVPVFHPYFAALLRKREECETMLRRRF